MSDIILGVEIGGTKLQLALGTPRGDLLTISKGHVNVNEGGEGIRQWLITHIPELIAFSKQHYGPIIAIGCGFGGPLDKTQGRVLQSIQIRGWRNFLIRDWFEDTFSLPTFVENDSNAATWGEYCCGFGKGSQHFFYTNLGSGVGGGFVFNGKLYDGQGVGAGEFGHTYVPDWTANKPGEPREVEQICSGWAIESRLQKKGYIPESSDLFTHPSGDAKRITCQDLAKSAANGDSFALREIDYVAHSMGIALANVLNLTNVERIAIGGGVSQMGEILIEPIRRYTQQYAFLSSKGNYQIQKSKLGNSIVLVGVILLAKAELVNDDY